MCAYVNYYPNINFIHSTFMQFVKLNSLTDLTSKKNIFILGRKTLEQLEQLEQR